MDVSRYGFVLARYSSLFLIEGQWDNQKWEDISWREYPPHELKYILLFFGLPALYALLIVFFFLTESDVILIGLLLFSPFWGGLWLLVYRRLSLFRGCYKPFSGTVDNIARGIDNTMKTYRPVITRISQTIAVVVGNDGAVFVGIIGGQSNPNMVIVHIHPMRRFRRSDLHQLMASLDQNLQALGLSDRNIHV